MKKLCIVKSEQQRNADVYILFRWQNTFLEKHSFTLGFKEMKETSHIYQTTDVPLIFYHLTDLSNATQVNRCFKTEYRFCYKTFILKPSRVLLVMSYIILTAQKTMFPMNVLKEDRNMNFQCDNRLQDRKWKDQRLMKPPRAPL